MDEKRISKNELISKLETIKDKSARINYLFENVDRIDIEAKKYVKDKLLKQLYPALSETNPLFQRYDKSIRDSINFEEAVEKIKEIHDNYHPGIVFVTVRSAVGRGYAIKGAWKEAWPDEIPPKILTINVKNVGMYKGSLKERKQAYKRAIEETKIKLKKYGLKSNIVVLDEMDQRWTASKKTPKDWMTGKHTFEPKSPAQFRYETHEEEPPSSPDEIPESERGTLYYAREAVKSAADELGYKVKVGAVSLFVSSDFLMDYRHPEKEQIQKAKNKAKELGQVIKEKQQTLEQKVSLVVAISGLVSSFFFLGSSVTGNAIGYIGQSSGSLIGVVLFLVGIAGMFFYFRKKQ